MAGYIARLQITAQIAGIEEMMVSIKKAMTGKVQQYKCMPPLKAKAYKCDATAAH